MVSCAHRLFCCCSVASHAQLLGIPWTAVHQASLPISISQSLLELVSFELVMPSNHLILCCPLLLLPSVFPSIRVFSNESVLCIRWPKYRSFRFSISSSNECSGLISSMIAWFDLLAVHFLIKTFDSALGQGTVKSLYEKVRIRVNRTFNLFKINVKLTLIFLPFPLDFKDKVLLFSLDCFYTNSSVYGDSQVAQWVKNPPVKQDTQD